MRITLFLVLFLRCTVTLAGRQRALDTDAIKQQEAMKKLAFLVGHWSGPATLSRGPSEPLHLTQTEEVQYKLDGLLLLVEGNSPDAGKRSYFVPWRQSL
jgi:hypothetical protein